MNNTIKILYPTSLCNSKGTHFEGYIHTAKDNTITIYITKYTNNQEFILKNLKDSENVIYGCFGCLMPKKLINKFHSFLLLEQISTLQIKKLTLYGKQINNLHNCILIQYDYDNIKDSQTVSISNNDYFAKLVTLVQNKYEEPNTKDYNTEWEIPSWAGSSMFLQHIYNYWRLICWLFVTVKGGKKVSIKQGNLILAIMIDLVLGYITLQLMPQNKNYISSALMGAIEKLIHFLYGLLKWLMGAPVGLKLNNAFNKMLGKYFSYHVHLWWLFLDVSGEKLNTILHVYNYIGYLGLTFQTAIVSDLICVATFHSYCIYVYAARLFNIQISGLIALLRLFVGRKYNPLRGGIDSCEYTNQELFVGTVAFTILLLLLPTTTLYYIVFTGFRVVSLIVQYILAKLIYIIQTSPLYVVFLWLTCSPKIKGNIFMEVISHEENSPLVLRIKLRNKSMPELINLFRPPVDKPNQVDWTDLLSNVFKGKQIEVRGIRSKTTRDKSST